MAIRGCAQFRGFLFALLAVSAHGQQPLGKVDASLLLAKQNYLVGEPIELEFVAKNSQQVNVDFSSSDPYGQCGEYRISVDSDSESSQAGEPQSEPSCAQFFQLEEFHCLFGSQRIPARGMLRERILLNRFHDFTRPGIYQVEATRHLANAANFGIVNQPTQQVRGDFTITIEQPKSEEELRTAFSPFLSDLSAGDSERKQEAAVAISSLPAPFLESYLLQMTGSWQLRRYAIEGLHKLNTTESRKKFFELVKEGSPLSPDQELAVQSLADMGDAQYGPMLLDLWRRNTKPADKGLLFVAAARLTRSDALPVIRPLLQSPDSEERSYAVKALAATELPAALPILVKMLNDASLQVRSDAAGALVSLTRESPSHDGSVWSGDPAEAFPFWSAWLRENPSLPIRLLRECPQERVTRSAR